ncbi:MAG: transcriptional regulator GcvA [Sulfuriferula sp.]|nr:transcriptional regulator GcvA [Sulfuriferula sp.]
MSRRLPSLNALRAFESVSRHRSFARAAEELNVTPAAVSQLIKQLENHFGINLFERGKTLILSPSALTVAPLITDAFDRLAHAVEQLRIDNTSTLIVSAPPVFAARWLIPKLDNFQTQHPNIEIRLLATKRMVDFAREDVDVAIRFSTGKHENLYSEQLMPEDIILVATPTLADNMSSTADLLKHTLLKDDASEYDPAVPDWTDWLASINPSSEVLRIRHFSDVNLVIQAAIAGLGIALVWRSLVVAELQSGRLVALLNISIPTRHAYYLVAPKHTQSINKISSFRRWLLTQSAQEDSLSY